MTYNVRYGKKPNETKPNHVHLIYMNEKDLA